MRRYDVAVVGCGVAGMAAALLLHRDGHRVTIFERFREPRPIGSGLMIQPTGLAVLDRLGLAEAVSASGARIDRLFGEAGDTGRTVLDVRYAALGGKRFGIGIHRASLFDVLHDAVRADGIAVEGGQAVAAAADGRLTFADRSTSARFDLIVDGAGARSPLVAELGKPLAYGALWASLPWPPGFDAHALQQRYRAASVMAGVLPIGAGQAAFFWSLRADRLDAWRDSGLVAWKSEVTALWPATAALLDHLRDADQLTFAHYAHRTLRRPAVPSLIHLGDAWHQTSPQLGQGANMALLDAWALAIGVREEASITDALARTIALRRRHIRLYQAMSALFTPVYQSDSRALPAIRDWLVGPLSKLWPATRVQAAMVSGLIGDPLRPLGLA